MTLKGKNYDATDFKMGVTATLPELSEWTLMITITAYILDMVAAITNFILQLNNM